MGMFDTFYGEYVCPECGKTVQFEEQTKDYERALEEFYLGDYIDKADRSYYYAFINRCPYCGKDTAVYMAVVKGQFAHIFASDSQVPPIETLGNIEKGYARNRRYEAMCDAMLGFEDIPWANAKELKFYHPGEIIHALQKDWTVDHVYKIVEIPGTPSLFSHSTKRTRVYAVHCGEISRIIEIRGTWQRMCHINVYKSLADSDDEPTILNEISVNYPLSEYYKLVEAGADEIEEPEEAFEIKKQARTPHIIGVEAMADYRLALMFYTESKDDTVKIFDVKPYIKGSWYGMLANKEYFNKVRLKSDYSGIEWPDGQDLAPHELFDDSIPLSHFDPKPDVFADCFPLSDEELAKIRPAREVEHHKNKKQKMMERTTSAQNDNND